jgi:hypothetical protein
MTETMRETRDFNRSRRLIKRGVVARALRTQ